MGDIVIEDTGEDTSEGLCILSGTNGISGTVKVAKNRVAEVSLEGIQKGSSGNISCSFVTEHLAVRDLSFSNKWILDLFECNFTIGFCGAKMHLEMDGLPVKIEYSDMMSKAEAKKDKIIEGLESSMHWEKWE